MSFKHFILMLLVTTLAIIVSAMLVTISLWLLAGIAKLILTIFYLA